MMSTAKFRNAISEFKRLLPHRESRIHPEDKLLLEFIEKITFGNLYESQEFKVKLLDRVQQLKYG